MKNAKRKSRFCTLFEVFWRRVILDEAHVIRNHKTGVSVGACKLKAGQRTILQSTFQNLMLNFICNRAAMGHHWDAYPEQLEGLLQSDQVHPVGSL